VKELSHQVDKVVVDLQTAVIRAVRGVTEEVDRRSEDRLPGPIDARVFVNGQAIKAEVLNLSRGGAILSVSQDVGRASRVMVEIDGAGGQLELAVLESKHGTLRGKFDRAAVSRTRLPDLLARLAGMKALKRA
jgi:hypothetical protein